MTSNVWTGRMDPELQAFIPSFPPADLTDPVTARKNLAELAAAAPAPETERMAIEDRTVPADPDVPVRIYRPHRAHGAIVWLHGGGFVMGDLETEHPWAAQVADRSQAVVVSVGYRLAPEQRFPAAVDDAYAAMAWTAGHAAELGIDPARIAVGGHAAGAGLAAAVALRARDQQGPPIRFQLLNQPELDDRQETWSARRFTDTPFMTRDKVAASWRHYLGSGARHAVRRAGTRRRSVRPAPRLHHLRGVRSEPRRSHRLRAAPAAGRRISRTAPVARHLPRVASDPVRRDVPAADRRTRRSPAPRPGRLTWSVRTGTRVTVGAMTPLHIVMVGVPAHGT